MIFIRIFLFILLICSPAFSKYWVKDSFDSLNVNAKNWKSFQEHLRAMINFVQQHSLPKSMSRPEMSKKDLLLCLKALSELPSSPRRWKRSIAREWISLKLHPKSDGLITAYFTPRHRASRRKSRAFQYPIYAKPKMELQWSKSRYEIDEEQGLKGLGLELFYMENLFDVFLIHVQGSATLELADDSIVHIGVSGTNEKEYTSLGKLLIRDQKISEEKMSLQAIRAFFEVNSEQLKPYLYKNERYVFFEERKSMPKGSMGAEVKAWHSVASERMPNGRYRFPAFMPMVIDFIEGPKILKTHWVLNQDTGKAIQGSLRFDLYLGMGNKAEHLAGRIKHRANIYLIWPKQLPIPDKLGGWPVQK